MTPQPIDIAVCTFRREHITQTLRSIAALSLPPGVAVHVIVADNDDAPSARERVEDACCELALSLIYIHAPARNISLARNACLDASSAPLLAFIDDDEQATPNWLAALLAAQQESGADVVLGPVDAVYGDDCPSWIRRGDYHSTRPVWKNGRIVSAYTCNVLINRSRLEMGGLRFRLDLGKSGGEDTVYFSHMAQACAAFAYAPNAIVTEAVSAHRATLLWLLKRRFRAGQTHGLLLAEQSPGNIPRRLYNISLAMVKTLFCLVAMLTAVVTPGALHFWLLRGVMHAGVASRLLGLGGIELYGTH